MAAALAREPSLLIADEVTSMVDQDGRDALMSVLSGLTQHHRMSLVHITHYNNEADAADRVINLTGNGGAADNTEMVETAAAPAATVPTAHHSDAPVLELNGVGHEYASGTPWATTALRDINFAVHEGDGVLIHGGNGSGKSTLAWIMAGLTVPTVGSCLLDGEPVSDQVGAVAISFQAARLQLMRSRVDLEVASAAGFSHRDHDRVVDALATVGLDAALAKRRIDQLSGGQMRRVVLAGLLARSPRALILDEPLAGLDAASQRGLLRLLEDLRRTAGLTVVVISHDFSGLEDLCPRTLHLHDGELARDAYGGGRHVMTAPAATRQRTPVVLLRPVPGDSVIHRLWAGTKLIAVAGIGVLLTFYPGWVPIGLVAALVLTTARLAHIQRGALPSIPRWLWILLFLGGATATFAGGSPVIDLGSVELGTGRAARPSCASPRCRSCCSDSARWCRGPPTSPKSLPRWPHWAGRFGRCGYRSTTGRWRWPWRCGHSRCWSTSSVCSTRRVGCGPNWYPPLGGRAAGGGRWRSSTCSPRASPSRCAGPTKWAMRSPPAGAPVKSRRRRRGRNGPTGWRFRSWSWCVPSRWRWN